jgi:hypothetical protein
MGCLFEGRLRAGNLQIIHSVRCHVLVGFGAGSGSRDSLPCAVDQPKHGEVNLGVGPLGTAALIDAGSYSGVQTFAPHAAAPSAGDVAGYEGPWKSTPISETVEGLPRETVSVNTRSVKIVDGFKPIDERGRKGN